MSNEDSTPRQFSMSFDPTRRRRAERAKKLVPHECGEPSLAAFMRAAFDFYCDHIEARAAQEDKAA